MAELLQMVDINKSFYGVRVLKDVSYTLRHGEVHVILGENGAGKSTLIKILSGAYSLDSGQVLMEGNPVDMSGFSPEAAERLGISTIYQHFHLVPHLSVAENISLSDFPVKKGLIRWKEVNRRAQAALAKVNFSIEPHRLVKELSVSQKQMLEIAIALSKNARILIMDEPTAAISKREVETLFNLIRDIRRMGVGIVYISHKLEEIKMIGDTLTVLRDGMNVGTLPIKGIEMSEAVNLMTGKDIRETERTAGAAKHTPFIVYRDFNQPGKFSNINFTVNRGEILGLTGLVGSGKSELARALFGADPFFEGSMLIDNRAARIENPNTAVALGIGLLPEDRDTSGLCLNISVKDNISLVSLARLKGIFFALAQEKQLGDHYVKSLSIKTSSLFQQVKYLSGGNKQKVIFAKWLAAKCRFLILDEPTIGIDVGAREEIYALIREFVRSSERSVLFISSDISEILSIADRILVMSRGKIVTELDPAQTTKQEILSHCLQTNKAEANHEDQST